MKGFLRELRVKVPLRAPWRLQGFRVSGIARVLVFLVFGFNKALRHKVQKGSTGEPRSKGHLKPHKILLKPLQNPVVTNLKP